MPRIPEIIVVPIEPSAGIPWLWGRVLGQQGSHLLLEDLQTGDMIRTQVQMVRKVEKIPIFSLVVPRGGDGTWQIGQVLGFSHVDWPFGPLLQIRDIITGVEVRLLPQYVDLLDRVKST
ncbi:MAG: hypothetical protein WC450_12310 [Candidatus Omnitrophota bacterium]